MKSLVEDYPASLVARPTKSLSQAIMDRRLPRHFTGKDAMRDEDLDEILRLGSLAPSGFNLQPWRFIVVRDPENKRRLQQVAMNQETIAEASVVIIALGMKAEWKQLADEIIRESGRNHAGSGTLRQTKETAMEFLTASTLPLNIWVTRQTMIAFTTMMLVAEALGYDTVPMEGFDPPALRKEFGVPPEAEVVALLAIGEAKSSKRSLPGRLKMERVVFSEKFGDGWKSGPHR